MSDTRDFDLEVAVGELFDRTPTPDLEALRDGGHDAEGFYADELRPNWDGLVKGERAARIESFARFANALGDDDPSGMGAVVRTKLLVLAWAFDRTYGDDFSRRLARKPERFGRLELSRSE